MFPCTGRSERPDPSVYTKSRTPPGRILGEAPSDPALARRVLDACALAPGQRKIGQRAEAKLRARELTQLAQAADFLAIQELRGTWLPGIQGADSNLLAFSEAARYLVAATTSFNPHLVAGHLDRFDEHARALENQVRSLPHLQEPLSALREQAARIRANTVVKGIPNPFRALDSLGVDSGPELFRGREAVVAEIESILADPGRSASLALLAPRRAGKTSLLKMLPRLLPDTVCVFFDLQAHPVASLGSFWRALAAEAIKAARFDSRIEIPAFPSGPVMEAAAQWLEALDRLPRRVLLCIDEFERLETLFDLSRPQVLQLMGLLRATIQHRRNVRLLISGVAPFGELDPLWNDHFISVRPLRLPFLERTAAVGLLTGPTPAFPKDTIPVEVADAIWQRTAGQPYLLQYYGYLLIDRLNQQDRPSATLDDVAALDPALVEAADSFFRDLKNHAPEGVFEALINSKVESLSTIQRRWLEHRQLVDHSGHLTIPLLRTWAGHHALAATHPV